MKTAQKNFAEAVRGQDILISYAPEDKNARRPTKNGVTLNIKPRITWGPKMTTIWQ